MGYKGREASEVLFTTQCDSAGAGPEEAAWRAWTVEMEEPCGQGPGSSQPEEVLELRLSPYSPHGAPQLRKKRGAGLSRKREWQGNERPREGAAVVCVTDTWTTRMSGYES